MAIFRSGELSPVMTLKRNASVQKIYCDDATNTMFHLLSIVFPGVKSTTLLAMKVSTRRSIRVLLRPVHASLQIPPASVHGTQVFRLKSSTPIYLHRVRSSAISEDPQICYQMHNSAQILSPPFIQSPFIKRSQLSCYKSSTISG